MPQDGMIGPLFILGARRSGTTQMLRMSKELLGYAGGVEGFVWQSVKALDDHFSRVTIALVEGEKESRFYGQSLDSRRAHLGVCGGASGAP
jgi:hypothetical protein